MALLSRTPVSLTAAVIALAAAGAERPIAGQVRATVTEERRTLATYPFSDPDPVPILASDERLYPYHRFRGYAHDAEPREWTVVTLENEWVEVWVLPEIGGKVWGARVKATGHEFIYRNEVVKFRNIALRGPWTSGGIEFNFGVIGHTPATATPVDWVTRQNSDGSASVFVGATDLPSRTRWRVEVRLPADRAAFETHAQWQNPTPLEQPYYNWMTGAAFARDDLVMSIPGQAYLEHPGGRRDWPIDGEGRDLAVYDENRFGGSKSYHVVGTYDDFFGGYYREEGWGFGHWAPYAEMPGQKLWLWALSRQGGIWEDLLTDTDGQYVEFQAGRLLVQYQPGDDVNPIAQAGFDPGASDRWTETWFPVEGLGGLTDASADGAMAVERDASSVTVRVHAFGSTEDTIVVVAGADTVRRPVTLRPLEPVSWTASTSADGPVSVHMPALGLFWSSDPDHLAIDRPFETPPDALPSVPTSTRRVREAAELVRGRRLAEARPVYEAVLAHDPWHREALLGLADLEYRRGRFGAGLAWARRALQLNAYDPEANFRAALLHEASGRSLNALEAYGWAARSMAYRAVARTRMSALLLSEGDAAEAARQARTALDYDRYSIPALEVLAVAARVQGDRARWDDALERIAELDPLALFPRAERLLWPTPGPSDATTIELRASLRGEYPGQELAELALRYAELGRGAEARRIVSEAQGTPVAPLLAAWSAWRDDAPGQLPAVVDPALVFPFRAEMLPALAWAAETSGHWSWRYLYALGLWGRDRTDEAWTGLQRLGDEPDYAPVYVTRSIVAQTVGAAVDREADLRRAISLAPASARMRLPLMGLLQDEGRWEDAIQVGEAAREAFPDDFDLGLLHVRSLVATERYEAALAIMDDLVVLPSEHSSEAHGLWADAHVMAGLAALAGDAPEEARLHFEAAVTWPERLGQGRPYAPEERLPDFLLGVAHQASGDQTESRAAFGRVVMGTVPEALSGGAVDRLDLLGAVAADLLGNGTALTAFGDGQEGAYGRLVEAVRSAAAEGRPVAPAVLEAARGAPDLFADVTGRLVYRAIEAAVGR